MFAFLWKRQVEAKHFLYSYALGYLHLQTKIYVGISSLSTNKINCMQKRPFSLGILGSHFFCCQIQEIYAKGFLILFYSFFSLLFAQFSKSNQDKVECLILQSSAVFVVAIVLLQMLQKVEIESSFSTIVAISIMFGFSRVFCSLLMVAWKMAWTCPKNILCLKQQCQFCKFCLYLHIYILAAFFYKVIVYILCIKVNDSNENRKRNMNARIITQPKQGNEQ